MSKIATMVAAPGAGFYVNNNTYVADSAGLISQYTSGGVTTAGINDQDIDELLASGAWFGSRKSRSITIGGIAGAAAAAASATAIVNAQALANGAITVAAQPDFARQLQAVVTPGTLAITAGVVTVTYVDVNGIARVEALSAVTPLSTAKTLALSYGVASVTSVVASGVVGGNSPTVSIGTTASLAIPIELRPDGLQGQGLAVHKATMDGVNATVPTIGVSASDAGIITPATAPNGTRSYTFGYSFVA